MGIFDRLFNDQKTSNIIDSDNVKYSSEAAAFLSILIACSNTDYDLQDIDDDGIDESTRFLVRVAFTKPMLKNTSVADCVRENQVIMDNVGKIGALKLAISQLSDDSKKSVFLHCFDLIFINISVNNEEEKFIEELAKLLGLDEDFINNVSEIIRLKYL